MKSKKFLSEQYGRMLEDSSGEERKGLENAVNRKINESPIKTFKEEIDTSLVKLCKEVAERAESQLNYVEEQEVINRNDDIIEAEVKRRLSEMRVSNSYQDILFSEEELELMDKFRKDRFKESGAIGGQFKLEIIGTSIGDIITMIDSHTQESIEVRGLS